MCAPNKECPWAYAIVLLLVSKFVNSQAAALAAIVPVALARCRLRVHKLRNQQQNDGIGPWTLFDHLPEHAFNLGVDPAYIVASAPACYGYYILPTYPSDLAAIQFDTIAASAAACEFTNFETSSRTMA
jgi:anaerobic C4-dicarboxylate transporter DcuB